MGFGCCWVGSELSWGCIFLLHESSSRVDLRLHTENQIPKNSGCGLKVSVLGLWVGWITNQLHCHSDLSCVVLGCDNPKASCSLLHIFSDHKGGLLELTNLE